MIRVIKCATCGKEFESARTDRKYCCHACGVAASNKARTRARRKKKEENDIKKIAERIKAMRQADLPKEYKSELARINAEARAHKMTYGKYVALKYARGEKV